MLILSYSEATDKIVESTVKYILKTAIYRHDSKATV